MLAAVRHRTQVLIASYAGCIHNGEKVAEIPVQ
jgi:hypothetical protein